MKNKILKRMALMILSIIFVSISTVQVTSAAEYTSETYGIGMSPLSQKISLNPGDSYTGTFKINNISMAQNFSYTNTINPYSVDENYVNVFDEDTSYTQITNWTTLNSYGGVLYAGENTDIEYTINVPEDAPNGGQYMAIIVTSEDQDAQVEGETSVGIVPKQAMAFLVYAEVAGTTRHSGEITDASVPGFLFSGDISGTSSVKNTGNVHSTVTYKLQVFPLFSNEEIYTNEENPETRTILPERTLMNTTTWEETPNIGIFNVIYTVEFEGQTTEVKKVVIVCPIWLLVLILVAICAIIIWLFSKSKSRKKSKKE